MKFCYDCANIVDDGIVKCPFCGGNLNDAEPKEAYHLKPGITLKNGKYLVGRAIGYGGFGVTYAAFDTVLQRRVAIKEYFPSNFASRSFASRDVSIYTGDRKAQYGAGLSRFLLEARNMAVFGNEPNIVSVLDFFEENNTAYIIMEYLDGTDLRHYLENAGGRLPYGDAIRIVKPACEALTKIHKEGIIHRDISPDNIFMTKSGAVKLIDFGAARLSLGDKDETLSVILKPGFAPPEQYRTKSRQGAFTDIYALGATFYRMITGQMPDAAVDRVMEDELEPPSAVIGSIPKSIDAAVMKAMALDYRARFQSAADFLRALDEGQNGIAVPTAHVQAAPAPEIGENKKNEQEQKKSHVFPLWAKLTAAGLAVCMLFSILMLSGVIKVKPASNPNKVTITPDEEHSDNYFVKVCAKPGTVLVYENSAGQRQEAKVSKRGCITFTVPVAALLPNEPIESDTFNATPVIYIKNEEDGALKQIENIEPVTLDVPTLTLSCENGDPIECENGMCLIKGKIEQTTANVFISVALNGETVIQEEPLPIAADGSFEKELKFEATGEYSVLIEARQNGYKIERKNLKAIVSEPPDPRKIIEIPDSFVTRAKYSDESIVVKGNVPVGTQIEVKSEDPEFSLKGEPAVDAEGNFSFEVNLPRTEKNYEMTIVATLSGGTVIERPFCVQRPPKYSEFRGRCWAYAYSEISKPARFGNQPFAVKGTISEIIEDDDYIKAKLTDADGNTLIIIYYDHFAGSGKKGQKLEAGQEYLLYGTPMQTNDDGLVEVLIWFVGD